MTILNRAPSIRVQFGPSTSFDEARRQISESLTLNLIADRASPSDCFADSWTEYSREGEPFPSTVSLLAEKVVPESQLNPMIRGQVAYRQEQLFLNST